MNFAAKLKSLSAYAIGSIKALFERVLSSAARIERREMSAVFAAFFLFFFVLGSYFAVRPIRETVATFLGRDYVADLWLYTAIFSIALVPVYGWLIAKYRRTILLPCIYGSVALILAGMAVNLGADDLNRTTGSIFYVWISVLSLMLVSVFWSFLLEMFSREQTKRLFGFIAAGGTLGALIGPLITRLSVSVVGESGILLIGAAGFAGAVVCQLILLKVWTPEGDVVAAESHAEGVGGNPFAGISIVLKSPYLLGIALFIVLLSIANTILYFEQLRIVEETFSDRSRRTEVFANIDFVVQSLTIFTQLFVTGRIAQKLGVRYLLSLLPIVIAIGFVALAFYNVFAVLVVVFVARRWGEYSMIRPGREMLFSGFDTETKYKAKNFVDVPVYRAADYASAQAKTAIDVIAATPAASLFIGAALAGAWAWVGWRLGRKQDNEVDGNAEQPTAAKVS
jgi:AAA family ATP:ADP antiporter